MKSALLALTLAVGLVLVGCGSDDSGGDSASGDGGEGEALYSATCASCHGPDATGLDGLGKDISGTAFVVDTSTDELVALVKAGRPSSDPDNTTGIDMPPKGGNPSLSDEDLAAIVVYLKSL